MWVSQASNTVLGAYRDFFIVIVMELLDFEGLERYSRTATNHFEDVVRRAKRVCDARLFSPHGRLFHAATPASVLWFPLGWEGLHGVHGV